MAYDEGLAALMRDELDGRPGITEKKMFGGLAFLLFGNMLCGVTSHGAMFRVGKEREAEALEIPGTGPLAFGGRPMGGMVVADEEIMADEDLRGTLMALAFAHAESLPAK